LTITNTPRRAYASKKAKAKAAAEHNQKGSTDEKTESKSMMHSSKRARGATIATTFLTPGSQQTITDPTAREEFARADAKMTSCVEWLRREVSQLEARASGRVTPQLLAPVRLSVSPGPSKISASEAKKTRLEELATVGVRDGSTLIVTVFDPQGSCAFFPPNFGCHVLPMDLMIVEECPLTVRMMPFLFLLPVEFEACSRRFI